MFGNGKLKQEIAELRQHIQDLDAAIANGRTGWTQERISMQCEVARQEARLSFHRALFQNLETFA